MSWCDRTVAAACVDVRRRRRHRLVLDCPATSPSRRRASDFGTRCNMVQFRRLITLLKPHLSCTDAAFAIFGCSKYSRSKLTFHDTACYKTRTLTKTCINRKTVTAISSVLIFSLNGI